MYLLVFGFNNLTFLIAMTSDHLCFASVEIEKKLFVDLTPVEKSFFKKFLIQTLPTIQTYTYNTDIAYNNNTSNTASTCYVT